MQGEITRVQVLAHPLVVVESFGVKVLLRSLFAGARRTFLDIVTQAAEEEAHLGMDEVGLVKTVKRFIGFERRVRDLYGRLSNRFSLDSEAASDGEAADFFATIAGHEEGHAIFLTRVLREVRRGRLWKPSRDLHLAVVEDLDASVAALEEEVRRGVTLARGLEIVESIEGSEINVVFDALSGCVDMRSRRRFERFFVLTEDHLATCRDRVRALRERHGIAAPCRA